MRASLRTALIVVGALAPAAARAGTITGRVVADTDHSGDVSAADAPIAGAVVVFEDSIFTQTNADGTYTLDAPQAGQVWVRPPDGYSPAPVWREVGDAGAQQIDLLLQPMQVTLPLRFVHVSDLHLGGVSADAVSTALEQAIGPGDPPAFVVATGDLTQGGTDEQFASVKQIFASLPVPVVPGLGNHDWYDGGVAYRAAMGPPAYSFDAGGAHFIMLHGNAPVPERLAFVAKDLALVAPGTPVFAFIHYPLTLPYDQALHDGLVAAGVKHVFTGHYHANRTIAFDGLVDHNVQPLSMGGIQLIPAGYEVVTIEGGLPRVTPGFVTNAPIATLVSPPHASCIAPGVVPIVVAADLGLGTPDVSVSIDGHHDIPLDAAGGWDFRGHAAVALPGAHTIAIHLHQGSLDRTVLGGFCVDDATAIAVDSAWPQLGGTARHANAVAYAVEPPLETAWSQTVGGYVVGGSPVLSDGRLFVPVADFGTDLHGGLVALDANTGELLWEARFGSLMSAPAVGEGHVIVAPVDGVLRAYDVATGALAWSYDLGAGLPAQQRNLYAAPVVADGVVYAGHMYHFAALDEATGAVLWETHPSAATFVDLSQSTPGEDGGAVIGVFGHGADGVHAYDATSGAPLWTQTDAHVRGMTAPPTLVAPTGFFGGSDGTIFSADLTTGAMGWKTTLAPNGTDYSFWIRAAPALANDRLFVPTQIDALYAADAATGAVKWRASGGQSLVRDVSYEDHTTGFSISPIATADVVWIAGDDGILHAFDAASGIPRWTMPLGTPVLSGVIPAHSATGDGVLYVAGFDGSVRALVSDPAATAGPPAGCGCGAGGDPSAAALVLVIAIMSMRGRGRRAPRAARRS